MRAGDGILAVERGGDGDAEALGQRHQLRRGARGAHAAAGDDDGAGGVLQHLQRGDHAGRIGLGAERRHPGEQRLDQGLHVGLLQVDLALVAAELQVHGAGRA